MEDKAFLGTGVRFPPQVHPATGRFVTVSGDDSIKESVYLILMTQKGERFTRPSFGSRAADYVFADTDATMLNLMAYELEQDLMANEPRLEEAAVQMDMEPDLGRLFLHLTYRVKGRDAREDIVFPFYMEEQPAGAPHERDWTNRNGGIS